MIFRNVLELPARIRSFREETWDYERRTSGTMAFCVAIVFTIYALLFLGLFYMDGMPPEAVILGISGMVLIVLASFGYGSKMLCHYENDKLSRVPIWALCYYSFLILMIFLLWAMGSSVSITPMFIIIIGLGFTWLDIRQFLTYLSVTLLLTLTAVSLVDFNYFWFLEFLLLYLFAAGLHLFHVGQQCKFFEYQQLIEQDRNTDGLTGLLNRRALEEAFCRDCSVHPQIAAILVDLDHFKNVNDTFGHAAGDQALTYTADIFRTVFRRDDYISRLGGDEFLVLLQLDGDAESILRRKIQALLDQVPLTFQNDSGSVSVTFSVGSYFCESQDAQSLEQMICAADVAMYQVKQNGRNGAVIHPDQGQDIVLPGRKESVKTIFL